MEDILEVYSRPYDERRHVVCMDEKPVQLLAEAREGFTSGSLAKRLEIHHTPKHGSWLDIAEIELSALGNQCLSKRRRDSINILNEELSSWDTERNAGQKSINWQFKTDDARIKLKHLYPKDNKFYLIAPLSNSFVTYISC